MECTCKECGRKYTYDDEVGYSKGHCGAYCHGRGTRTDEVSRLRALLGEAGKQLAVAAYTVVGDEYTVLESKCFDLAARIAKELEETK